jgi:hypothetical protein
MRLARTIAVALAISGLAACGDADLDDATPATPAPAPAPPPAAAPIRVPIPPLPTTPLPEGAFRWGLFICTDTSTGAKLTTYCWVALYPLE